MNNISRKTIRNRFILTTALSAFALMGIANAQTAGSGTLEVTASVQGSLNLTFVTDGNGLAVTGTTTSTGALPFGTVSMYGGTIPANVIKTVNGTTSFDLSTPFDVRVDQSNSASTTYTLSATLATADASNKWSIGGTDISSAAAFALTSTGAYATAVPYVFKLEVPATEASGSVSNSIGFTAISN
jgi:hypothetical protein